MQRRALISVYDKSGVVEFAQGLVALGYEIVSTGGTHATLKQAGVPVTYISDVTGFPEILDGRVKTLHPRIHGGLLARRDDPGHMQELASQEIAPIDVVAVNLYPFGEVTRRAGVTHAEAVENIDIGGPTMVRAAAKNHAAVTVVVNPEQYPQVLAALQEGGPSTQMRLRLAQEAFAHTAAYDALIQDYLRKKVETSGALEKSTQKWPSQLSLTFERIQELRYGENPHQSAAFYRDVQWQGESTLASARQLHGKELSYNNISDAAAALEMVREFTEPAVVAVKHANPCGLAVAEDISEAYQRAYESDPVSIFGGIVACNRTVDAITAEAMSQIFLEVIIAPAFEEEALAILTKKPSLRLLQLPIEPPAPWMELKRVPGGLLVQDADIAGLDPEKAKVITETQPTSEQWSDLRFGWLVVKHVKSNAIVLVRDGRTVGVGAGQMNRIQAAEIAIAQAGEKCQGAVLASDAFFPFDDVVKAAAKAGIKSIIQPGGSKRDADSVKAANEAGLSMVFTGMRHFRH